MNLDFFAARTDFARVFELVFAEELRVFEAYSRYGERCRELRSVDEVRAAYPGFKGVHVMLWAPATCRMANKRIPFAGRGVRYAVEGLGLIQLLLGNAGTTAITPSHLAHNTAAGAARWGPTDDIDFAAITRISGRIVRGIRKLADAKCHVPGKPRDGKAVLPEAAALVRAGRALKYTATAPWSYVLSV